ncbi:MAG: hypothetical protein Q7S87_09035 [Agitococcus sp.]|nr:hypothetical protein [Agitococcus sp.]MDO9177045.1 hypothetical protein [Agitococcus sp.]
MISFIKLNGAIHMVIQGKPVSVSSDDKHFDKVEDALKAQVDEQTMLSIIDSEKNRLTTAAHLTKDIVVLDGMVTFKGETVDEVLSAHMLQMLEEGFNLEPMAAFLANLRMNPSNRVVTHLYSFLQQGKNPITKDGCFLAYKAVTRDFKDIYSGQFDNSIGKVCSVPRRLVDDDPRITCSHGLHVCSFAYLPSFAHADGHVVVCKINPADVVAIPFDYSRTKMRVCKYEVIGEYEGYYIDEGNVLANTSVSGPDTLSPTFEIVTKQGVVEKIHRYHTFALASESMPTDVSDISDDTTLVQLWNRTTGVLLHEVSREPEPYSENEDDKESHYGFSLIENLGPQGHTVLDEQLGSLLAALSKALDVSLGYTTEPRTIQILAPDGKIVKTITN